MTSQKKTDTSKENRDEYRKHNKLLKAAIDYETIGYHMKEIRRSRGLTQAVVAERMHWSVKYYASVESGKRLISLPKLIQFVGIMGISADLVLTGCHPDYPSMGEKTETWSEAYVRVQKLLDKCGESELRLIEIVLTGILAKR